MGLQPVIATELACKNDPAGSIERLFNSVKPQAVVCEDYKIYAWKSKDHSWSSLFTPRLIGMIQLLCHQHGIPLHLEMAQTAKGFVTDNKLKEWGAYEVGSRHARDSLRHGFYWLMFGKEEVI